MMDSFLYVYVCVCVGHMGSISRMQLQVRNLRPGQYMGEGVWPHGKGRVTYAEFELSAIL